MERTSASSTGTSRSGCRTPACSVSSAISTASTASIPALHERDSVAGGLRVDPVDDAQQHASSPGCVTTPSGAATSSSSATSPGVRSTATGSACPGRARTANCSTPMPPSTAAATTATRRRRHTERQWPCTAATQSLASALPPLAAVYSRTDDVPTRKRLESGPAPYPLGATWDGNGVNFALFSAHAERVDLCLFDARGRREIARYTLPRIHRRGLARLSARAAARRRSTATASTGRTNPRNGHRFNHHKLLHRPVRQGAVAARCAGATRTTATASARRAAT